jgi:NADPH2:quinone reductase
VNHLDLWTLRGIPGVHIVPPWILGADATGILDAVGDSVTHVGVGSRVIVNPGISCGTCEYCRAGEQSLCIRFGILGEHHPGTLADFVVVPGTNVRSIPPETCLPAGDTYCVAHVRYSRGSEGW